MTPWLAYYGDDFTGSTDVMEVLQWFGLRTALFMAPPTPEALQKFSGLQAVGIAGTSRSMSAHEMRLELPPIFASLQKLAPAIVHYKTCSTFDSSPEIGSIGVAIESGQSVFGERAIPVVVGAPHLGRYQAFGNLFASSGAGSEPYRLDRHPTMSRHPTTPMHESDLRLVLGRQTTCPVALINLLDLENHSLEQLAMKLEQCQGGALLFDAINRHHQTTIGQLLHRLANRGEPQFMVGSSGVEAALSAAWPMQDTCLPGQQTQQSSAFAAVERLLVISGSCSPVSQRQLDTAERQGFVSIAIETDLLVNEADAALALERAVEATLQALGGGRSVILHTSRGPDDPRVSKTNAAMRALGMSELDIRLRSSRLLGPRLGAIVRSILEQMPLERIGIAGGDSSGYIVRQLGITALEAIAPVTPGAPLCRATGPANIDGLQLVLKGGQVGPDNLWQLMLHGTLPTTEAGRPVT